MYGFWHFSIVFGILNMRFYKFLTIFLILGLVFIPGSSYFFNFSSANSADKHAVLQKYVQNQWESPAAFHKIGPDGAAPQFVVFFAHGFLSFDDQGWENSWNEYVNRFVPALEGLSYVVYHPGFKQTKEYQSFAQDLDVYEIQLHLEKLIGVVDGSDDSKKIQDVSLVGLPLLCVGHSNGASSLIVTLSSHHKIAEHVKGLVLLAPYADIREASTLGKISALPGGGVIAGRGMRLFFAPMYDDSLPAPVEYIRKGKWPAHLPAIFIASHNDHVVPHKNFELFKRAFDDKKMISKGLITMLDLQTGGHNWIWRRVRIPGTAIDKKSLTDEQRKQAKLIKHQSYLSLNDRLEVGSALQKFVKQHVLGGSTMIGDSSDGFLSRIFGFVKDCFY